MNVGLIVLAVGLLGALVGFACALTFLRLNPRSNEPTRRRARRGAFVLLGLLAMNFPVALAYIELGIRIHEEIYLHIVNASRDRIDEVSILNLKHQSRLGPLGAGQQLTTYFSPRQQGPVALRLSRGTERREVEITGYASGGLDDSRVVISEDFRVSVEKLPGR